jgi:exodeoxyribonuclease III
MKIATWNVNSVKARKERLLAWLGKHQPDVLCLQETKTEDASFPTEEVAALGYRSALHGQRTYNGVAILSRHGLDDVRRGMNDGGDDTHARLISAISMGVRVISAYVPNGSEVGSDKWAFKLAWLERLQAQLSRHHTPSEPLVLCGDLNIAPDDHDVARPDEWRDSVLCASPARAAFTRLAAWGLRDVLREKHPDGGVYSWWDYRMLGFPKNNGLRIDHILATHTLAQRCTQAVVDREERKGKLPSDHAPVIATFSP